MKRIVAGCGAPTQQFAPQTGTSEAATAIRSRYVIKLGGVPPNNGPFAFWIRGQTLIAPEYRLPATHGIGQVQFFAYPSGAGPTFTLNHTFYYPTAAVVSLRTN